MATHAADIKDGDVPVRDASTVIIVRNPDRAPAILMGQRGRSAAFMPDKVVFPGGAVDRQDHAVPLVAMPDAPCRSRLQQNSAVASRALMSAAIREVFEETGMIIGRPGAWADAPADWSGFAARGCRPDASSLRFFFRAVTPPGRPRRFDARFFLTSAAALQGDIQDFSSASAELSHLRWVPLEEARALNLAFITRLVLAELAQHLPSLEAPEAVPMVRN
ncbi:MAG: NUDIX hydrolase, partial [Pseudomonadota bacterium]